MRVDGDRRDQGKNGAGVTYQRSFVMPREVGINAISTLLGLISHVGSQPLDEDGISLDFAHVTWVDTMGLCLLSHWFEDLQGSGVCVELMNLPFDIECYMQRMDLFKSYDNLIYTDRSSTRARHEQSRNLVEIISVTNSGAADAAAYKMAETIISRVSSISNEPDPSGMSPSPAEAAVSGLGYVFSELLDNSLTHGRRANYNFSHPKVAVQYVRGRGRLTVAILDNGCGLFTSLNGHRLLVPPTDNVAIRIALIPKVSCNRDLALGRESANQGIGLTVSTRLATKTGGNFTVFSGQGCYHQNGESNISEQSMGSRWQGTGVFLDLNVSRLQELLPHDVITTLPGYREEVNIRFG